MKGFYSMNKGLEPSRENLKPFLQPLAVAVVCLVLVCVFLIAGFMNLRALDRTLNGLLRNNAQSILVNVIQVAEGHFQQLKMNPHVVSYDLITPLNEFRSSAPEDFLIELTELASSIEFNIDSESLNTKALSTLISDEDLWLLAFLDSKGSPLYQNRPIPEEILSFISPLIQGTSDFKMNIYDAEKKGLGVISLRHTPGSGIVVLGMDRTGFRTRGLKFSLKKAIDEIGLSEDIAYFIMLDEKQRLIGLKGEFLSDRVKSNKGMGPIQEGAPPPAREIEIHGSKILEITSPIIINNAVRGTIGLGLKKEKSKKILNRNRNGIIISTGFMILIAFLSVWFLYLNQTRYLNRMQAMERRLNRFERLSALGRLAGGVAHEIRNPLNAISMAVQRLHRDEPNRLTNVIKDEIKRLNQIIEEFLGVSKSRDLKFQQGDLRILINDILLLLEEETRSKRIRLETQWHNSSLMISMDQEKMKQAVFNILKNACESISHQGIVTVSSRQEDKDRMVIEITDTGVGMEPAEIEHIFEFDYTTKDKGLGLGLALANEIIMGHGGEIQVFSMPGRGTTFEIILPVDNP